MTPPSRSRTATAIGPAAHDELHHGVGAAGAEFLVEGGAADQEAVVDEADQQLVGEPFVGVGAEVAAGASRVRALVSLREYASRELCAVAALFLWDENEPAQASVRTSSDMNSYPSFQLELARRRQRELAAADRHRAPGTAGVRHPHQAEQSPPELLYLRQLEATDRESLSRAFSRLSPLRAYFARRALKVSRQVMRPQ